MKIETIPESIVNQARHILESANYNSRFRVETIRLIIGTCAVCDGIPTKYIINKQDGISVIGRYCDKDFEKYQKYNKKTKKTSSKVEK